MSQPSNERAEKLNGEYTTSGIAVAVQVSPCSWMYANYGFQFGYTAADGSSWGFCHRRGLPCEDATRDDVQAMLDALPLGECDRCGQPHLVNPDGNRGTTCERCFITALNAEMEALQAEEDAEEAREDAKARAGGFRYKVCAWVHPPRGDDHLIVWYSKSRPTKAEVVAELCKRRSRVETDYSITKL